jgi:tellurite methyltransferase
MGVVLLPYNGLVATRLHAMPMNKSVAFFDTQFQRQIDSGDYALNPFERAVLPYVRGTVVDLGCGLGNLSMAAAGQCTSILALDASQHAVDALKLRAQAAGARLEARTADLAGYALPHKFDTVLCIGLLMFFAPDVAHAWLDRIKSGVEANGIAAINVLIEGTTFLDMFAPGSYTLFAEDALPDAFRGWQVEHFAVEEFGAPGGTIKRFATIVARNA